MCSEYSTNRFPEFEDVNPKKGSSGTVITINGKYFTDQMVVNLGGYECTNVVVSENGTLITATIPEIPLNIISTLTSLGEATYIILNTSDGYTDVELSVFVLNTGLLSDALLKKILDWLKNNPIVVACVVLAIAAAVAIGLFFIVRRNIAKKRAIADAEAAREAAAERRRKKKAAAALN
eukprot:m51a1_g1648 hypothetical protein (179) ;mRNA; r:340468-341004